MNNKRRGNLLRAMCAVAGGGAARPADQSAILQWLKGGVASDGLTLIDKRTVVDEPVLANVTCLTSSGAQTISNAAIVNGAVVVNAGTAVGTATAGVITFTAGTISQISLDGVMTYICEEGTGLPYDVSGSGNHITSMTTTWTTADGIPSWNHGEGFSLYEHATLDPLYVPYDVNGLPLVITPPTGYTKTSDNPAGFTHNISEADMVQGDANFADFGASASFYGNGVDTWNEKTYAQIATQYGVNGDLNLWVKMDANLNVVEMCQYPLSKVFTVVEAEKNLQYFGTTGDPMREISGELIIDVNGYIIYTA